MIQALKDSGRRAVYAYAPGTGSGAQFPNDIYRLQSKYFASQVAERVASLAVEVFGGSGFVKDYPVEKLYRDAKIGKIYEGTSFMQLATIAKLTLGKV